MKLFVMAFAGVCFVFSGIAVGEDTVAYSLHNSQLLQQRTGAVLYSAPTRNRIAYVAFGAGEPKEVRITDLDTGEDRLLVSSPAIDPWCGIAISPDEQYVLYTRVTSTEPLTRDDEIWRVNIETLAEEMVLTMADFAPELRGEVQQPCITSVIAGDTVAYKMSVIVWGYYDDAAGIEGVYVVDVDESASPQRSEGELSAKKVVDRSIEQWWYYRGCASCGALREPQ